jgi:hypothetical protein
MLHQMHGGMAEPNTQPAPKSNLVFTPLFMLNQPKPTPE